MLSDFGGGFGPRSLDKGLCPSLGHSFQTPTMFPPIPATSPETYGVWIKAVL